MMLTVHMPSLLPSLVGIKTSRKGIVLVAVPLLVSTLFLIILAVMLNLSEREAKREAHNKEILMTIQRLDFLSKESTTIVIRWVFNRTNADSSRMKQIQDQYDQQLANLKVLVADDPELSVRVQQIKMGEESAVALKRKYEQSLPGDATTMSTMAMAPYLTKLHVEYDKIVRGRRDFADLVMSRQKKPAISSATWREIIICVLSIGLSCNIGLSLFLSSLFSRSMTKRLSVLVDNSMRLSAGQSLNAPLSGADEIASLDEVFHDMAAKLEALARKEKAMMDEAVDVICSLDYSGRIVAINPACTNTWRYPPDELLGRHISSIVSADDIEATRSLLQGLTMNKNETSFENQVVCKDQTIVHMLWSVFWSQEQKQYFCVAHDVTQRKIAESMLREGEARMRQILESVPLGLVILSPDGAIEIINQCLEQMFGYSDSELIGKSVSILVDPTQNVHSSQLLEELLQPSLWGPSSQLSAITKGGAAFPAELVLTEFFIFGERKWLVVIADISPRKETERVKQEFIAMVSHDLRTPLTTVMMTMQSLLAGTFGELNEKGSTRIAAAQNEVSRLVHLINGLLEIDRLEAGRMEIQRDLVDINDLIARSISSVGYLAEKNGIQIIKSVSASDALADDSSLIQVLVNLLANAIKFSTPGSTIEINAEEISGTVEFRVKDQGRGIPASSISTVFDRFRQVERSDHTEKGGSGLGLAICKSIVEAHGGTIGVESIEGAGSTFWFRIPVED